VQTLRFTRQDRVERDNRIAISTEHVVGSPEEAQQAGAASALLVAAFVNGYGNSDTSAWQPELEVQ
jgi:hypothetical protein